MVGVGRAAEGAFPSVQSPLVQSPRGNSAFAREEEEEGSLPKGDLLGAAVSGRSWGAGLWCRILGKAVPNVSQPRAQPAPSRAHLLALGSPSLSQCMPERSLSWAAGQGGHPSSPQTEPGILVGIA